MLTNETVHILQQQYTPFISDLNSSWMPNAAYFRSEPYEYDGSSTESEQLDDDDDAALQSEFAPVTGHAPSTAAEASIGLTELAAATAASPTAAEPTIKLERTQAPPTLSHPIHCANCGKASLADIAGGAVQLKTKVTHVCPCCKLSLPAFCYAIKAVEAVESACVGRANGGARALQRMRARTERALKIQCIREKKKTKKAEHALAAAAQAELDAANIGADAEFCSLCRFPLLSVDPASVKGPDACVCSCCKRLLPV